MNSVIRVARAYWLWNERAWLFVRRFERAVMSAVVGVAIALWIIGVNSGNTALEWAPAIPAGIWLGCVLTCNALDYRDGH